MKTTVRQMIAALSAMDLDDAITVGDTVVLIQ